MSGGKDSYIRESGIRWKSKLDTNSISANIVEFGFYDSEKQVWHILPVESVKQEICLVSTCNRIPV